MAVTILAVMFLFLVTLIAFAGSKMLGRERGKQPNPDAQKCSLCQRTFEKSRLIERQVGDYRLFLFCRDCVLNLYADLGLKN